MPDSPFLLTKIIATLGPASDDLDTISRLIRAGARIFRINFSHGSTEAFDHLLTTTRQASQETGIPVAVLGDLSGPKIRIGKVVDPGVELKAGDIVHLTVSEKFGDPADAPDGVKLAVGVTVPEALEHVAPGEQLLVDDGTIALEAVERIGSGSDLAIACRVGNDATLKSSKGVNLPQTRLDLPSVTDYDWQCVDWAVDRNIDFLALSFVRNAKCVEDLRAGLRRRGVKIPIVAKIEKPQALEHLDEIVRVSNAVMVARGDLGVEMDMAQVPEAQQRILDTCIAWGKTSIVATQMLQSMIDEPVPTRAEVSDVAGAIYNGADAIMLSGETAVGAYPEQAVAMMARIAKATRTRLNTEMERWERRPRLNESRYRTAALAHGVYTIARDIDAQLVVTWSEAGGGARYLSKMHLSVPVIAFSRDEQTLSRMAMLYGVIPVRAALPESDDAWFEQVDAMIQKEQWAQTGDPVLIASGQPLGIVGVTNQIRIQYVGDVCRINQ